MNHRFQIQADLTRRVTPGFSVQTVKNAGSVEEAQALAKADKLTSKLNSMLDTYATQASELSKLDQGAADMNATYGRVATGWGYLEYQTNDRKECQKMIAADLRDSSGKSSFAMQDVAWKDGWPAAFTLDMRDPSNGQMYHLVGNSNGTLSVTPES